MSSMVNGFETDILELLFQNATLPNIFDATGLAGTGTPGSSQLALATTTYAEASTSLATNEISYTGYSRPTQARSAAGWTVASDVASNAALITFGLMSGGAGGTAVSVGLGLMSTGNDIKMFASTSLSVTTNVEPQFAIGALTWTAA
jgi:hypothetical protein